MQTMPPTIKVNYKGTSATFPKNDVDVHSLIEMFGLIKESLHLIVLFNDSDDWMNCLAL